MSVELGLSIELFRAKSAAKDSRMPIRSKREGGAVGAWAWAWAGARIDVVAGSGSTRATSDLLLLPRVRSVLVRLQHRRSTGDSEPEWEVVRGRGDTGRRDEIGRSWTSFDLIGRLETPTWRDTQKSAWAILTRQVQRESSLCA